MSRPACLRTDLPFPVVRGKVRDVYDLGARLLLVATDRISAFDVVMNEPVAGKGVLLTQLSRFWLESLPACKPHHLDYVATADRVPAGMERWAETLADRTMVVCAAAIIPVECVVRGYLVGGGWKEYQSGGSVSGVRLPAGLRLADRLPEPIFTPSTKAASGHDEPISYDGAIAHLAAHVAQADERWLALADPEGRLRAGSDAQRREWAAEQLADARRRSLAIYQSAWELAAARGILLADTKFEFGLSGGRLLVADEVLTPDSSRFWPADGWQPGRNPPSYDKQYLRDYLESLDWPKTPPPPQLPESVLAQTRARYVEAFERLTGRNAGGLL